MAKTWLKNYGSTYFGRPPDYTRCCEVVSPRDGRWPTTQCSRKARFDPDEHGRMTHCKVHSDATRAERRAKWDAEWAASSEKHRKSRMLPQAVELLRTIAEGHNDPRSIAKAFISEYDGNGR